MPCQYPGTAIMSILGLNKNIINEDSVIESLTALKRAGSSAIVTYFALDVCKKLIKFK